MHDIIKGQSDRPASQLADMTASRCRYDLETLRLTVAFKAIISTRVFGTDLLEKSKVVIRS